MKSFNKMAIFRPNFHFDHGIFQKSIIIIWKTSKINIFEPQFSATKFPGKNFPF